MTLDESPPTGGLSVPGAAAKNPEPNGLSLRKKVFLSSAMIAVVAALVVLGLLSRLTSVIDDAQLSRHIGWSLLVIALSAGTLSALTAWVVVRRITRPLKRLAETMSRMAQSGEIHRDFPSSEGGSEVQLIEETFRSLVDSLEESRQARERSYAAAVGAGGAAAAARAPRP